MKAQDLRMGNLAQTSFGIIEYRGVSPDKPNLLFVKYSNGIDVREHIDDIKPIPLTKEWLVKLKNDGSFKLRFIKSIAAFEVQRKYVGIESGEEWIFISNVRYVHEWQNLHYALTSEELELNENMVLRKIGNTDFPPNRP